MVHRWSATPSAIAGVIFNVLCTRITALLLVSVLFARAAEPAATSPTSACQAIADTLPPLGTVLPPKPALEIMANVPRSVVALHSKMPAGLVFQSTYAGSLNCQRNTGSMEIADTHELVAIPDRFVGGEGALCGDDKVWLVTVSGLPALVDAGPDSLANRVDLDISVWNRTSWSASCRLAIDTEPHYGIVQQFCDNKQCDALAQSAERIANPRPSDWDITQAIHALDTHPMEREKWERMASIALSTRLLGDDLPTFGQPLSSRVWTTSFWDADRGFLPVMVNGELLLGKVGTAGWGNHFGEDVLLAAYRLSDDKLEPVAGYFIGVTARLFHGYNVGDSPP
jgi:hypothetical protein